MNIILFGPPGAGKGTQADNLVQAFNLFKISTGDLLRKEINKKSFLGNKIKSMINTGLLVPDDIINNFIQNIVSNKSYSNRLVFDGYPRNLNQVSNLNILLKKNNQEISCVLSLKIEQDLVIKRILGRQICSSCGLIFNIFFKPSTNINHQCDPKFLKKRSDDNEKTIKNRFVTYAKETAPILNYYKKETLLYEIDGSSDISTIYQQICQIISLLDT